MNDIRDDVDLENAEFYINRELSQLAFFERVLAMAARPSTPVLERLRFLTICSTITDEFFEIRVAGLKQRARLGVARNDADGLSALETLSEISKRVRSLLKQQYNVLNDEVLPAMEEVGIRLIRRSSWDKSQRKWAKRHFETQVAPVLTPIGLDPAHPFPQLLNKSLNMIVALEGADAFGRATDYAVLHVPRCLPRVIALPPKVASGPHQFVLLSSIIHAHVAEAFPGMKVRGCHQFRVTRNADLWVEEEGVEDLLDALKGQLHHRRYGDAVRLEVAANCPSAQIEFLRAHFRMAPTDVYKVDGPVNLHRLKAVVDLVDRVDLKYPPFTPAQRLGPDLFETIGRGPTLLFHPYESFIPVVDLVRQAAQDPAVLAIKQTVYRTGTRSPIVEALIVAARAGKEVTAVIELRARFDEAHNIGLATQLQEAGAHVVYGVVGYKTHAKMLLIVRREGTRLRRYVHLGTGNYHTGTARQYTDFSLMTADEAIGADVHKLFMQLTGLGKATELEKLVQSPFTLAKTLEACIDFEIGEARAGRPAFIRCKINALSEATIIKSFYRASNAGVQIDLIVRGICCLRAGVPGVSENIRVRSVVGRFLEHTRIYHFHAGGEDLTYLASADLMGRNLYRRVEACFPIEGPDKERVLKEGIDVYLADNVGAWTMLPDGKYIPVEPASDEAPFNAQTLLLERLSESYSGS